MSKNTKKIISEITSFENIEDCTDIHKDITKMPLSGSLKDLTCFIIHKSLFKLKKRFTFYTNVPDKYGKFIRINLNPWLFYIYMCQLISKFKIGTVFETDFNQEDYRIMFYTDKFQKDFYKRFELLKNDIRENLKFTARFCGKMKFNQNFDTSEYGLFDYQTINSDDIDFNGLSAVSKTFGITPGILTMSNDNHLIKTYTSKIVELHVLIELFQSIIHPKVMELITEFTERFILKSFYKNLKSESSGEPELILMSTKHLTSYDFERSEFENNFFIFEANLLYKSYHGIPKNNIRNMSDYEETKSTKGNFFDDNQKPNLIISHLNTIKVLYGAVLNFNQSAISLSNNPYETELYDFLIDYGIFDYKFANLNNFI